MSEPIRVLQFVTQMNRGGMESRLMDLYRSLDRERIQLDFYTLRKEAGQFDEEIASLGGRVYYSEPLSVAGALAIPARIEAFLREHSEYRICHAHLNQWCGLILEGARRAGVPVRIAHARTALAGGGKTNVVKNLIKHLYASSATHRFAVSEKAAKWLYGTRRVERLECDVWPNAIEAEKFLFDPMRRYETRKLLSLSEEQYVVLHVGNLRAVKNHEYLFAVFSEILKSRPDAVLLLAGRGERYEALQELAHQMKISSSVRFLGSRSDIPELLSAADVFIFPSFYEGLPGSVLEAQAAGLPCLISDTIAHEVCLSELVTRLSIELDAAEWARAALSTCGHKRGNMYETFASAGYDISTLARRLSDFYIGEQESALAKEGGKKKVLLVSNTLSFGGAERQISLIANALNDSGLYVADVLYYAQKGGSFAHGLRREPIFVDKDALGSVGCVRAIARHLKQGQYDVLHAAGGGSANIYGRAAALLARTPVILGMMLGKRHFASRAQRLANNVINLFAREWSVNNPALIPILAHDLIRIDPARVHLLYNSFCPASEVDYRFHKTTEYDLDADGNFIFGTVGRCVKVKNFPLFLSAAALVCQAHENVRFWVLGDGVLLEEMKELALRLGISERVRFWGFCEDVDVALSRMHAYVQSSDSEGTPNTVLEAMRASRPILTTENTDLSLIVEEGKNGFITPCGDVQAMAQAMERILALTERERADFGAHSLYLFEQTFLEKNAVVTWDTLYRRLLEEHK